MLLETIPLEHIPPTHTVHAALFKNVQNAAFLQSQLLARNTDFEFAFFDASSIISRIHILAAVFRAIVAQVAGTLKTPNVHSEIILCMSASNNISEAYKKFGITPSTTDIIVIKVLITPPSATPPLSQTNPAEPSSTPSPATPTKPFPTTAALWTFLTTHITGTPLPFTEDNISPITDWPKLEKLYKITGETRARIETMGDAGAVRCEREVVALAGMALRGT